jgi:hypothetical protein
MIFWIEKMPKNTDHCREYSANTKYWEGQNAECQPIWQKILTTQCHPKEKQMASLMAHFEEGGQCEQKIGRTMKGTFEWIRILKGK